MAHAALHFAIGSTLGLALAAPQLRQAWQTGKRLGPATLRCLGLSWGIGILAVVPSLLRYAGVPESSCAGWWMNVFVLHPLLNRLLPPCTLVGTAAFAGTFVAQYALILAAMVRVRRR
jgi:hypothetical protein